MKSGDVPGLVLGPTTNTAARSVADYGRPKSIGLVTGSFSKNSPCHPLVHPHPKATALAGRTKLPGELRSLDTIELRNLDDLEEQSKPAQDLGKLGKVDGLYDVTAAPQIMTDLDLTRVVHRCQHDDRELP